MAWMAPDGVIYDEVDADVIADYYSEDDLEEELTEDAGSVTVLGHTFDAGAILRRMDHAAFREAYNNTLDYYARDPESLGFEEVDDDEDDYDSESVRTAMSGAYNKGKDVAKRGAAKTKQAVSKAKPKKAPAKTSSSSCRSKTAPKSKSTKQKTKGARR